MQDGNKTKAQLITELVRARERLAQLESAGGCEEHTRSAPQETPTGLQPICRMYPDLQFRLGADGTILDHQKGVESDVHLPPGELVGRRVQDLLPPDARDRCDRACKQVCESGKLMDIEYTLPGAGEKQHHEMRIAPFKNGECLAFIRNITGRKRADEALRESEGLYRATIESTADGILVVNEQGRMTHYNARFAEMWRVPEEILRAGDDRKALGYAVSQLERPQEFLDKVQELYNSLEEDFDTLTFRDGRVFERFSCPLVQEGVIKGRVWSFRDVTERERMEESLKASEEQFRNLAEHLPGVSIQGYYADGTVFYWNKASEEVYGYTAREAMGADLADLIIPQDLVPLFRQCLELGKAATTSGEFMPAGELMLLHKEGHLVPVHSIHTVVCIDHRKPMMFCIDVDLSKRKKMEDELREAQDQLEERVEARTRDLQTANERLEHEITVHKEMEERLCNYQERLRSLASQLSLAEERERRRIAAYLHDEIAQPLGIANMRLGELKGVRSASDVDEVMAEVHASIRKALADTRELTYELSPPGLREFGFKEAMESLLARSMTGLRLEIDFTDDGRPKPLPEDVRVVLFLAVRELLVNTAKHAQIGHAGVSSSRDGSTVRICVQDDGVGFTPGAVRSGPTADGGFGLFSIGERLEHLGGRLEIESSPGHGTRTTLIAPLGGDGDPATRGE